MAGMKWYGSNTANKEIGLPRSILMVMLNDKTTGAPVCLMSGNLLSAYRTGAIPGVGLRHLAPKGAKTGAIYGPGVMGKTSLDAFMATCPELDTLKVKGRGKKSLDSFLEYVKATYPQLTTVTVVDDIETLVRDSDVISFAATAGTDPSKYAYVKGEWIKPGALIVAPSAFDMETDFLKEKCKMVVDNIKLYIALGVNGHGSLHIALEALLRALHAVAAIVELIHCADAVGGCIRLRHRQQGTGNRGACALQGGQTDRQGDGRNAHGCIARQPLAPQRYGRKRVGCLLHVITCLFFILPGNPGQQLRPLWLLQ